MMRSAALLAVFLVVDFVTGQAFTPEGLTPLSFAGRCFLTLALSHFLVNLLVYVVSEKKIRMKDTPKTMDAVPGAGKALEVFDTIFTEERLATARGGLTFVPIISILMLFILFRSKDQKVQISEAVEFWFALATLGITLQLIDMLDMRLQSDYCGNLSAILGMAFTYFGYAGIVYGAIADKNPDIPLSGGALAIICGTFLVFIMQAMIKYLEYHQRLMKMTGTDQFLPGAGGPVPDVPAVPGMDSMKNLMNESKLNAALTVTKNVPLICVVIFYLHFRMRFTGNPMPPEAELMFYVAVAGIWVQALGVLLLADLNPQLGMGCRTFGMLMSYGGFGGVVYYAVSIAPPDNVPTQMFVMLTTTVAILQIVITAVDEYFKDQFPPEKKKMFEDMLGCCDYAVVLSILLLYCHFRHRVTGDPIPGFCDVGAYLAVGSLFAQMGLVIAEGFLAKTDEKGAVEIPSWTGPVKGVCIFALYLGFGGLVASAFTIGVP